MERENERGERERRGIATEERVFLQTHKQKFFPQMVSFFVSLSVAFFRI